MIYRKGHIVDGAMSGLVRWGVLEKLSIGRVP
jgi:hypothetical protein